MKMTGVNTQTEFEEEKKNNTYMRVHMIVKEQNNIECDKYDFVFSTTYNGSANTPLREEKK